MPTYDYECAQGHTFEAFQQITAKPLTKCIKCGKKVKRLIGSGAGIIFKGSGFYATDYPKRSRGSAAEGASKAACPHSKDKKGCDGCPAG